MKTKFTLDKTSQLSTNSTIYLLKTFLILFLITTSSMAFAQNNLSCNAELKVEKDRNIRSSPSDGTYYSMVLTNKSTKADLFSLSYQNFNGNCDNPDGSNSSRNVNLKVDFVDQNLKSINEISLNPGQTVNFYAHINVPKGTVSNSWSCTKVMAESQNCQVFNTTTILRTLVIDSSEE
jgi:hypothetical protein